jgi:ribonuclease HII
MSYILGIDEVGRGCLAGPVYMASVLLDKAYPKTCFHLQKDDYAGFPELTFIRDSKKLSEIKRKKVLEYVVESNISYRIIHASCHLIDKYGIGVCLSHIVGILLQLTPFPLETEVIIDGQIKLLGSYNPELLAYLLDENGISELLLTDYKTYNILRENKADDNYLSVALASSVAKVIRDELMSELHKTYPQFDWDKNKGYGTVKNREAIKKDLDNPHLRQSYLGNIRAL